MTSRVLSTPQATRDLIEIGVHIGRQNPPAAERTLAAIERQCRTLARMPKMGRRRPDLAAGLRSFAAGAYVVFYRITRRGRGRLNGIEIIRVLHGARDIPSNLQ